MCLTCIPYASHVYPRRFSAGLPASRRCRHASLNSRSSLRRLPLLTALLLTALLLTALLLTALLLTVLLLTALLLIVLLLIVLLLIVLLPLVALLPPLIALLPWPIALLPLLQDIPTLGFGVEWAGVDGGTNGLLTSQLRTEATRKTLMPAMVYLCEARADAKA